MIKDAFIPQFRLRGHLFYENVSRNERNCAQVLHHQLSLSFRLQVLFSISISVSLCLSVSLSISLVLSSCSFFLARSISLALSSCSFFLARSISLYLALSFSLARSLSFLFSLKHQHHILRFMTLFHISNSTIT